MESHNKNTQRFVIIRTIFCRRATRGGGEGGLSCPYLNIGKKRPNFGKNPDCGHVWVKFLISSAIFKSFQEKEQKKILWELFCHVVDDCLLMCPKSKKTPLP